MKPIAMSPENCILVRPSKKPGYLYGTVAKAFWFYLDPDSTRKETLKQMYYYVEDFVVSVGSAQALLSEDTVVTAPEIISEEDLL